MTEVQDVATMADAGRAGGAILGGGTVLMRAVNAGEGPARLIRVTDPGLRTIRAGSGGQIVLGAAVTMAQVIAHRDLAVLHPVARAIGGPQIRSMATVAGNLFAPHPYGDFAVALIALGARAVLAGQGGARTVEDLMRDRERPPAVAAIEVPVPRPGDFGFLKVSRVKPKGVSVMSIAALLPREGGRIRGARIAWGAMGPSPMRGPGAERALEGQALDASVIARAAAQAAEGLSPPTDWLASEWYRREVAGVHLRRLLERMT